MGPRQKQRRGWSRWLPMVLLALVAALVATHLDEASRILRVAKRAEPEWIGLALLFQAGTYAAVGMVYRTLSKALRTPLPLWASIKLAVVNLFVNSAVPSAGLSGNLFLVRMMTRGGIPAGTGALIVLLERTVYFASLAMFVSAVVAFQLASGHFHRLDAVACAILVLLVIALGIGVRKAMRSPRAIAERLAKLLERAPRWVRMRLDRPALLAQAQGIEDAGGVGALPPSRVAAVIAAEGALLLLDSLTVWALFHAIGATSFPFKNAAMSFALSTLFSQVVVVPGALEVGLAGLLKTFGARTGAAVAVTLLFHAVSFWLPMPLGWFFYRGAELNIRRGGYTSSGPLPRRNASDSDRTS